MRLYNALIHYFLFLFLSLSVSHCFGHEHHNHVDPVTTKYAQPAAHIDPLSKNTENAHVHQHTDDEHHHHDTIDARLRAKHQLRQSVHQHSDDGRHEDEEAYINRLNSALEDRIVDDLQFQHAIPPTIDLSNDTQSPNQTRDDVPHAPTLQNDTASTPSTSIQPPTEQKLPTTDDVPSSTERPPSSDNQSTTESADKVVSAIDAVDETILTTRKELHEQQSKDARDSKLIEEETLIVHRETLSSTPAHQEPLRSDVPDPILDSTPPTPVQQSTPPTPVQQLTPPTIVEQSTPPPETLSTTTVTESDRAQNISTSDSKDQQDVLDVKPIEQPATQLNSTDHAQSDPTPSPAAEADAVPETQSQPKDVHAKAEDTTPPKHESKDEVQPPTPVETPSTTPPPPTTSTRILRSSTLRNPQKLQGRHRLSRSPQENLNSPEEPQTTPPTETTTVQTTLASTPSPPIEQPTESSTPRPSIETTEAPTIVDQTVTHPNHTDEIPTVNVTEPLVLSDNATHTNETDSPAVATLPPTVHGTIITDVENPDQILKPIEENDLPRQVHVHDPRAVFDQLQEEVDRNEQLSLEQEVENSTDASAFLNNDHSTHLPRILESEEMTSTVAPIIETSTIPTAHVNSNIDDVHTFATGKPNHSDPLGPIDYRQVCWRLPKPFESGVELIENQVLRVVTLLPEYAQTLFYDPAGGREKLVNTVWFGSISAMCFFFSFVFLSMGAKRLKQSQHDKKIRAVCQQLQQHNNQLVLERDTFEKQNQKLTDEIDALRNQPISDSDEAMFELRERYDQLHSEWQHVRVDYDAATKEIDRRQSLIQKHDFEMQKQVETVAHLNDEILRQKQDLEKERETIARLQTNDLSLERFETLQATIHDLKGEISQLKQEKFAQTDELQQLQEQTKQFDLDNNQLTNKMKQLKDLLQQRDETISRLRHKGRRHNGVDNDDDEDDDDTEEKSRNALNSTGSSEQSTDSNQKELLSKIDDDVEKANQHLRDLHVDLEEKTRRIKELDALLNQEKERCRELETKLKVVLELRERDAHLHIRQLGQTDAELRKARTDTERVRILQQQLQLKEQQLEDVQKVLNSEQVKFSEECSKLQHETHEKWMEVKKLTRELEGAKKECESLRRQISKYGNSDRSSQEKTMHKPVPHHVHSNAARASSDPETNGNSPPPPLPYPQNDNFRPIDHERNDSGAASPSEMFRIRPPLFGIPRPPFYPPPFMPPPPPNPFLLGARFPMPIGAPHGMISPISHLMTNGSGGGSDANSFEIVDSTNITPNSVSYDAQLNGSAVSPTPDGEQQATAKVKKPKKSLKKKTKTSNTTVAPGTKEDV